MAEDNFSKGSWEVCPASGLNGDVLFYEIEQANVEKYRGSVATIHYHQNIGGITKEEALGNAYRIAAVNDLYDELDMVHRLVMEACETGFNPKKGDWADSIFRTQGSRFEALKKARGES